MTVTGAARKQAGLYYDKGGAYFNVMHPDFGAKGDGTTDDSTAIQAALTAAAGLVPVVIPRTAANFQVGTALSVPSNSRLQIDGTVQMTTRLDALFTATSQSNIHISGKGKIKGTGTHYTVDVSRLFYFISCSDFSLIGPELSLSVWGAHFETCTDFDFDCRVRDISDTTDGSQGYGCLVSLNSARFRIAGRFSNVGRHSVYLSAGASEGVIDDVIINNCYNTGVMMQSFAGQNPVKNITLGSVVINVAGLVSDGAIHISQSCENITISDDVIVNSAVGHAIDIEGSATNDPTENPRGIVIGSPTLAASGQGGIRIVNASHVTIGRPRIRTCVTAGIQVSTSGSGIGSVVDDISINSYDIESPGTNGITISGADVSKLTNIRFGRGSITSPGTALVGVSTGINVKYTGPAQVFGFSELAVAASQTSNPFVANPAAAYWIAPESGYVIQLAVIITGVMTAGTNAVLVTKNGSIISPQIRVDFTGGVSPSTLTSDVNVGYAAFAAGDKIGVVYTTNAGFLPTGTLNAVAQVVFVPFA